MGLEPRDVVTAGQVKHLFGTGCDRVSGRPLGSPYKVYANEIADAFNTRVDELLAHAFRPTPDQRAAARSTAAREFFVAENGRDPASARELSAALARYSRPRQTAVAGARAYDGVHTATLDTHLDQDGQQAPVVAVNLRH